MRVIIQRVSEASVEVQGEIVGQIGPGLLVYVGVADDDDASDAERMATKVATLRIFEDDAGKMNCDLTSVGGSVLAISNFSLCADARQGRRPGFDRAAPPEKARGLYDEFCQRIRDEGVKVETGRFREQMAVRSINDGPINILLDSKGAF